MENKMKNLNKWVNKGIKAKRLKDNEHIAIAKEVLIENGVGYKGMTRQDMVAFSLNVVDMKDENFLLLTGEFYLSTLINANFICDTKELEDKFIELIKKDINEFDAIRAIQDIKFKKGIGQDLTANKIKNLIEVEDFDGLKDKLEQLKQKKIDYDTIAYFVKIVNDDVEFIEGFLDTHRKYKFSPIFDRALIRKYLN